MALLSEPLVDNGFGNGLGVELAGCAILVLAACLAAVALVRAGEAHLQRRPPGRALAWLGGFLGVVGAVLLALLGLQVWDATRNWSVAPFIWTAAVALVVSAWRATVVPRPSSGPSCWPAGQRAVWPCRSTSPLPATTRQEGQDLGTVPILVAMLGLAMPALLVVAALSASADRTSRVEHTAGR